MSYVQGRLIHDADSHLMEKPDCLESFLTNKQLSELQARPLYQKNYQRYQKGHQQFSRKELAQAVDENIMLRKNWQAHGAFLPEDRVYALNQLGFASQLVFTTFCLGNFGLEKSGDLSLCYATASAHNRMMTDFCSVDRRLLAVAYVPLEDFDQAIACGQEALNLGAQALMVPSFCPQNHSPSHTGLFPLWAMAEEAGVPVLFHVGGEERLSAVYKANGLAAIKDFQGGDDNFTSVSYMPIANSAMQTLATLIFDGILDKFLALKWGVIELGASWLPGWMRSMDSAATAFIKNEERLKKLSDKPSEIVKRQVRVTPYPHEDAGWIIANSSKEVCMFSSDYPHIEGGRNPLKRFDASLSIVSEQEKTAFFYDNFVDLMGPALKEDLRYLKESKAF